MADTAETETPPEDMVALPEPLSDLDYLLGSFGMVDDRLKGISDIQNAQTLMVLIVLGSQFLLGAGLCFLGWWLR